jgi:hypothetical protein
MELHAVVLSWLHGLPCPVRNRPEPDSRAGPGRHPFLAAAVAHAVGLRCPAVRFDSATTLGPADALLSAAAAAAGRTARPVHVACLDGQAFTSEAPGYVTEGISALAAGIGAREALIGVDFVVGPAGRWFAGITPVPGPALRGSRPLGAADPSAGPRCGEGDRVTVLLWGVPSETVDGHGGARAGGAGRRRDRAAPVGHVRPARPGGGRGG